MAIMSDSENTSFFMLVADVGRLLRTQFDRRVAHLGLTRAQWRALKRIHRDEGQTQSTLAEMLEMDPIAVGRVIDRLQDSGFVERRPDPADRRCWRLHITSKAHGVVDELDGIADGLRRDVLRGVKAADLRVAQAVLTRNKDNLAALADSAAEGSNDE
jgi:DNA-binding MarR family transcriptional regulator